jgi:hypothetical protein
VQELEDGEQRWYGCPSDLTDSEDDEDNVDEVELKAGAKE